MPHDSLNSLSRRDALGRMGLAALALRPFPVAAQPKAPPSDAELTELLQLASVPSLSMAVVNGDRITTRSLGVLQAEGTARANADTVYAAASLTKAVFAYVLLGLVHEGALSLDRPVREYLALPNPADPLAAKLTVRHLLSHSGGWRNWRNTTAQALTADFEPGTRWSYSGEGFYHLQRIAESLTGKGIGQLMRERVFVPLGMTRSSMALLERLEANRATGHGGRGQPVAAFGEETMLEIRRLLATRGKPADDATTADVEQAARTAAPSLPVLPNFLPLNAAASLLTTAADFVRFLKHLVNAPQAGGAPAAIVAQMMTPQIRCNARVQWGLGVGLEDIGANRSAWQWGDNPGFKNYFFADPGRRQAMVVFTNGDRGARVYERLIRGTMGEDRPGFLWS